MYSDVQSGRERLWEGSGACLQVKCLESCKKDFVSLWIFEVIYYAFGKLFDSFISDLKVC